MQPKRHSATKKPGVTGRDSLSLAKARLDRRKRQSFSKFKETVDGTTYTVKQQTFNDWTTARRFAQASNLSEKHIHINKVVTGHMRCDNDGKTLYVDGMLVYRSHTGAFTVQDCEETGEYTGSLIAVPADFVKQCRKWKEVHDNLSLHLLWVHG